jgi:predicted nucleic acid-binding protein
MTTAIDTNVISALWDAGDALCKTAQNVLEEAQRTGGMVICPAVHAELLAAPGRTEEFVDRFCEEAGIVVEWELSEKVWRAAGVGFQQYAVRRRKQRDAQARRILADFLIGAHALVSGYKLLTLDAGIYQVSFPRLGIRSF